MPTLINICGASRSGTTMLDLMLGNSTKAFSCGEVFSWFRPWRQHHFKLECQCGNKPCSVWEQIAYVREENFHQHVLSELNVDFLVDSSKDLCWVVDSLNWASSKDIATYNILIWKNPINLAYSHWKRGKGWKYWYKEFISYHESFLDLNIPYRAVNYNALVNTPQKVLAQICKIIEMEYFEGKERFWENKNIHYLFGSGITSKQVTEGSSTIWQNDNFPSEFKEYIPSLENWIAQDTRLLKILDRLKKNDIYCLSNYSEQGKNFIPKKPYPLWYYGKRSRQIFRRFFPEKYSNTM